MNQGKGTTSVDLEAYIQIEREKIEVCGQSIVDFLMDDQERALRLLRNERGGHFVVTDDHIGYSYKAIEFANEVLDKDNQVAVSRELTMAQMKEESEIKRIFKQPCGDCLHKGFIVESEKCIERIRACLPEVRVFRAN